MFEDVDVKMSLNEVDAHSEDGSSAENFTVGDTSDEEKSDEVGETSDEICEISDEGITASGVAAVVSDKVFEIFDEEGEVSAAVDEVSVRIAETSDVVDGISDEVEESSVDGGNIPGISDEVSDEAEHSSIEVMMSNTDEGTPNEIMAESSPRTRVTARMVSATWRCSKGRKHHEDKTDLWLFDSVPHLIPAPDPNNSADPWPSGPVNLRLRSPRPELESV
ncbi:hypothetical protein CCHR01_14679 [Colletotrichum chrysophilum]|uniref:Uncharacterized protein n=1 Tax=Colletotrichum chrysophilum TaxID=1836956 RepID=A0AAD9ECH6_9PEZI|nr:hypothetical protein CCHR01_14679 [Colletotrichum chrysophilum]